MGRRIALALTAGILASTSACAETPSTGAPSVGTPSVGTPSGGTSSPTATTHSGAVLFVHTGAGPVGLTTDLRGRVWTANADAGTVSRLTASGDAVSLRTHVGAAPLRLAVTDGSVWVTVFSDGVLRRLDDDTGRALATVDIGTSPEGVTVFDGSLWVVLENSGQLVRVDLDTGRVIHRYPVGAGPRLAVAGGGLLWVSSYSTSRLVALDPTTGRRRATASVCAGPQGMVVAADTVWVACTLGNELVGVDRRTLAVSSRLALPGSPDAVQVGPGGRLLVALQKGPTLAVIDPAGSHVVRRLRLGQVDQLYDRANIDLEVHGDTAWVSSYLEGGVYRVRL